ncbi:uncharacterized protein At5g48480-like [Telopea speciosissima]|uniref:uncharacterized protein At5g48480-like n=1 Tax=Telopea speciosissima TaxID=54955 RepID=UPI001CC7B896|nr:uncharacterized protein At5g48480-like [Telopea speciosissima]
MAQENAAIVDDQNGGVENGSSKAFTFSALKPHLTIPDSKANEAVQFYRNAFGGEELKRAMYPKRKAEQELPLILAAEIKLGSSVFLVSDQAEDSDVVGSAVFCLETEDVDGSVNKAVAAGATIIGEISEGEGGCCGGRVGKVKDPYGYIWMINAPAKECGNEEA